ncbi:MAG TPA: CidA/LrgA family protein [Castellaniella sp.]|uniref:CidA/LrgA family protein n=1 Tax=Castellaniella sp. TaxID=1955812 RepID=UPI002EE96100
MIGSLALLLLMQLVGTLLAQFLHIPLPGPVIGMLLLFAYLLWRGSAPVPLVHTTQPILENLSLLFVPAGVGIIAHWRAAAGQAWQIALVLMIAAAITLLVTGWTLHLLLKCRNVRPEQE